MDPQLEIFILYYLCWHEGELTFSEYKRSLIEELQPEGMAAALRLFKPLRGPFKTYFEAYNKKP